MAGFDLAAVSSEEQELAMKTRHVVRALTVAAMTCGLTSATSILRAQDHHDPYLSSTSPKAVEQTSPQPVDQTSPQVVDQTSPNVIEESSPKVDKDSPRDPYVAKTSPKREKAPKVSHHKNDYGMQKGHITIVGCFFRELDSDGDHAHYLLADAKMGPATTVASQDCVPTSDTQMIRLREVDDAGLNQIPSNRWVEIFGEMGKPKDADDQRRFEVKSFREVPLTPAPRVALFIPVEPAPAPAPAVETPAPEPQAVIETPEPVATTGVTPAKLPKTASQSPLIALLGLLALSGGGVLGLVERRQALGRG
jgi:LPXTG-motif cell wall-anchored protein